MTRIALPLLALLALSACATRGEPVTYAETASAAAHAAAAVAGQSGETPQQAWDAGNTAYLAWNGARRGWTTTESGLQYRRVGKAHPEGAQPSGSDTVRSTIAAPSSTGASSTAPIPATNPPSFP